MLAILQMRMTKLNPSAAKKLKFSGLLFHFKANSNVFCEFVIIKPFCFYLFTSDLFLTRTGRVSIVAHLKPDFSPCGHR